MLRSSSAPKASAVLHRNDETAIGQALVRSGTVPWSYLARGAVQGDQTGPASGIRRKLS